MPPKAAPATPSRSASRHKDERGRHNASRLPRLSIDNYNLALRDPDSDGYLGDRASQTAFRELLETARAHHLTGGEDPFGKTASSELGKKQIDLVMVGGDPDAAHLVHLAVEEYARRLVHVVQVFLSQPEWHEVDRIVLGGGFPDNEAGGLAIRRAIRLLGNARVDVALTTLRHHADEGGLLGWVPLLPEAHHGHDAFLAVDVGGTNIRCGIVQPRFGKDPDGGKARVLERLQWRHADDDPDRGEAIARLAAMLNGLNAQARTLGIKLAPFVGVACPGMIQHDGGIPQGAQNLPGDWELPFNLPEALGLRLDRIGGKAPKVVMHNDAVVQGLSEHLRMRKARRWAVLTIGTGLGNATYSNR